MFVSPNEAQAIGVLDHEGLLSRQSTGKPQIPASGLIKRRGIWSHSITERVGMSLGQSQDGSYLRTRSTQDVFLFLQQT